MRTTVQAAKPESAPEPKPVAVDFNLQPTAALAEDSAELTTNDLSWSIYNADKSERIKHAYGAQSQFDLSAGDYYIELTYGDAVAGRPITLHREEVSAPLLILNAAAIDYQMTNSNDEPIDASSKLYFLSGETHSYGGDIKILSAGEIKILSERNNANVEERFSASPGETIEKNLVIGFGRVQITLIYGKDEPLLENSDASVTIYGARRLLDGSRDRVDYDYSSGISAFDLTAGDYVAIAEVGNAAVETPFSIEKGTLTELTVDMKIGVLALSAPGAYEMEVHAAEKDLQGNQERVKHTYGDHETFLLSSGEYVVNARLEDSDQPVEQTIQITAAQREEVTFDLK